MFFLILDCFCYFFYKTEYETSKYDIFAYALQRVDLESSLTDGRHFGVIGLWGHQQHLNDAKKT